MCIRDRHGRVLAGSVNIDMIAAAAPNTLNQLRVQSEGYDLCVIGLDDLSLIHIWKTSPMPKRTSSAAWTCW